MIFIINQDTNCLKTGNYCKKAKNTKCSSYKCGAYFCSIDKQSCQYLFHFERSKQSKLFNKENKIYQRFVNDIKRCISNKQNKNQRLYDSIFVKNNWVHRFNFG